MSGSPLFSPYKALDLRRGMADVLSKADYLAEYDVILLDPGQVLFGLKPGEIYSAPSEGAYLSLRDDLQRRSNELQAFLTVGGLLVVTLELPSVVLAPQGMGEDVDSYGWWLSALGTYIPEPSASDVVNAGTGHLRVIEPGHPFEQYLLRRGTYDVRIATRVLRQNALTVLAENRVEQPVAAEIAVGKGAAVLVPPPIDEPASHLLSAATFDALQSRFGGDQTWQLDEEIELESQLQTTLRGLREVRQRFGEELAAVRGRKEAVMGLPHVSRAMTFFEKATRGTPTPQNALPALYKLVETVTDAFHGEREAAHSLGIPRSSFEDLRRLANDRRYAVRHAPIGLVTEVEQAQLEEAIEGARNIVAKLIEYEYQQTDTLS